MLERFMACFRRTPQSSLHKPLARLLAIGALGCSTLAGAVGLGDITLHSSLGQPLNADIELVDTAGLEEADLTANLASADEFARAGVDRIFFLNTLRFTPMFRDGRKVIHVVSSKAVTEPYLNFLVQVNRPGGQLLREFTLLLDPPGTAALAPAPFPTPAFGTARVAANTGPTSTEDNPPVPRAAAATATAGPLPAASQGKRYVVAKGDNLWSIGKRLQAAGTTVPMNQLVREIRALNPESVHLAVGQSLLLPDAAVLPGGAAAPAVAPVAVPEQAPAAPEQLASTVLENQQLQKDFDALQARLQSLESQVADKDKHVADLESQLAANKAPAPAAALVPPARPAVTPAAPIAIEPIDEGSDFPWLQVLAAAAVIALLVALVLLQRRKRQQSLANAQWLAEQDDLPSAPMASATVLGAMAAEASQSVAASLATSAVRRETSPTTDALDGASIYIAYGRFNEALGILDDGLGKEPERTDLRVRKLEVLGMQGNVEGFEHERQALLGMGYSAQIIDEIHGRYPKLAVVTPVVVAAAAPLVAAIAEPAPQEAAGEHLDEFQLNLDDLSMDADWDLVSPFETAVPTRGKSTPELDLDDEPGTVDAAFASNLKELPEVVEMPDEQFLSDFADSDETFLQADEASDKDIDGLDDAFLDNFVADADLPELDALTVDFDALDSQQESAEKLEQAQSCIDLGDLKSASDLLHELLREGDESCKHAARQLLARIA
ncbi:MAG: hypothetical protein PW845_27440 [Pseudomonas sp.]|nr:hypothetical protein [Pseudomonas sp.]